MNKLSTYFGGVFAGKQIFVTGHTGFKGAWLAEWLLSLGAKVHGFALSPPTEPALFDQLGLRDRLHHELGDVCDAAAVSRSLLAAQPDFVFHLAAQSLVSPSYAQPIETYSTNVMGTVHVLDALRALKKPCAAVFITTDKCYENREWLYGYREDDPLGGYDPYSSSKAAAEIAIASYRRSFFQNHPVKIASARAGNVIGGGDWAKDRIVPDCIRALQQGQPISVRNPRATRPWQHVLEPLSGYLWLAACLMKDHRPQTTDLRPPTADCRPLTVVPCPPSSDCRLLTADRSSPSSLSSVFRPLSSSNMPGLDSAFNFGPTHESNRTVGELVQEVLKHWPGAWEDRSDPHAVHEAGLLQLSIDKAHALLGWSPVWTFPTAIEQTVRWYRHPSRELTLDQISQYTGKARELGLPWAASAL
jgi:CDP-glucose 4,6-dehydratase